jgi:hypothetical protein
VEVALDNKMEVLYFYGPRLKPPPNAHILVKGVRIPMTLHMRYLGLTLDPKWSFKEYFPGARRRLTTRDDAAPGWEAQTSRSDGASLTVRWATE